MKKVSSSSVKYRKTLLGKDEVVYNCPDCQQSLKSPLDDSGNKDHCPHCECVFIVPGKEKRLQIETAKEEERLQEEKAKEEERVRAKKAKEEERLRIEEAAKNEERLQALKTKEEGRLRAKKTKEAQQQALKEKNRNSNHYISLGLMHALSAATKSFWIAILTFIGCFALSADSAREGFGVFVGVMCFIFVAMLVFTQWMEVLDAIEAFKDGSDPDKTTD